MDPEQSAQQAYEHEKAVLDSMQAEIVHLDVADLERQIAELQAQVKDRNNQAWDARKAIKAQERKVESTRRLAAVEIEAAKQAAEIASQHTVYEERTASEKWRERAFPHQLEDSTFLAHAGRALCANSMGTGKTLTSLMTADKVGAKRVLVVSPGEVMSGFQYEFSTWSDRHVFVLGRQSKAKQMLILGVLQRMEEFTVILNYETWRSSNDLIKALIATRFDMVIVDEAHQIKNVSSNAYRGVERIVQAFNNCPACSSALDNTQERQQCECGWDSWYPKYREGVPLDVADVDRRSVKTVLLMTGTFILNRPEEIYAALHLVDPLQFPTQAAFVFDYCDRYSYDGQVHFRSGGQENLTRKIRPYYIRKTMADTGIVLPPQTQQVHRIEFDAERYPLQAEIMQMIQQDAQIKISENETIPVLSMLAMLTRMRQAAIWPGGIYMDMAVTDEDGNPVMELTEDMEWEQKVERVHVGANYQESQKLDYATDLIWEMVDGGHRVVVFSQFREALIEEQRRLEELGVRAVRYDGQTPPAKREEIKSNFNRTLGEEPKWEVLLCHYRTGGVGLNLTAATEVVILDEEWNPGKNNQAYDRIHRIGQTEEVGTHILRMTAHIDTWMAALNKRKKDLIDGFDEAMDNQALGDMLRALLQGDGVDE
jgi:SNF2 family DNA or RNA helicase